MKKKKIISLIVLILAFIVSFTAVFEAAGSAPAFAESTSKNPPKLKITSVYVSNISKKKAKVYIDWQVVYDKTGKRRNYLNQGDWLFITLKQGKDEWDFDYQVPADRGDSLFGYNQENKGTYTITVYRDSKTRKWKTTVCAAVYNGSKRAWQYSKWTKWKKFKVKKYKKR